MDPAASDKPDSTVTQVSPVESRSPNPLPGEPGGDDRVDVEKTTQGPSLGSPPVPLPQDDDDTSTTRMTLLDESGLHKDDTALVNNDDDDGRPGNSPCPRTPPVTLEPSGKGDSGGLGLDEEVLQRLKTVCDGGDEGKRRRPGVAEDWAVSAGGVTVASLPSFNYSDFSHRYNLERTAAFFDEEEWVMVTTSDSSPRRKVVTQLHESATTVSGDISFLSKVGPVVACTLTREEQRRQEAIFELIFSEQCFRDDARQIIDVYLRPLRDQQILTEQETDRLFANLPHLLEFSEAFSRALLQRQDMDNFVVHNIGDILLQFVRFPFPFPLPSPSSSLSLCPSPPFTICLLVTSGH